MTGGTLYLWDGEPQDVESRFTAGESSLRVTDRQQTLDEKEVLAGEAANIGQKDHDGVRVLGDGTIEDTSLSIEHHQRDEWLGKPSGEPPFALLGSSDADYLRTMLTIESGCDLLEAAIDINAVLGTITSIDDDVALWEVGWRDPDLESGETAIVYPDLNDTDQTLINRATSRELTMLGFEYENKGEIFKGEITQSGYLNLSNPDMDDWQFAGWLGDVVLPHARIPEDDE